MGILNVTPDSFSDGGRFATAQVAVAHARRMVADGADIIDIGGESTRPGADEVGPGKECDRVLPIIEALLRGDDDGGPLAVPVSVDTRKATVADAALRLGCHMVNDVSAARDPKMADVLRNAGNAVPIVIMHMLGAPKTMQEKPSYVDAPAEVATYLCERAEALESSGIARTRIIVDPGIGFGKRLIDNLDILKNIDVLGALGYPVLVGASRKSFIGTLIDADGDARLAGSLAAAATCYTGGVDIVRVHDVRETVEMFRVLDAIAHPESYRLT